jgi:hypothetical protein
MKYFISVALLFFLFGSCQKDDNKLIVPVSIPFVPNHNSYVLNFNEDSFSTVYLYNTKWKIQEIKSYNNSTLLEEVIYNTKDNVVKKTSNKNDYIYTYYLNKKGYADSCKVSLVGYVNLTEYYKYNTLGFVIEKKIAGDVVNVPYLEITNYTYENGNLIKEVQTNDADVFTIDYTYYTDSLNVLAGTEEAKIFIPQSKNLVQKITYSDDTFLSYSYALDDEGNFVVNTINQFDEPKQKVYKLEYLKQ